MATLTHHHEPVVAEHLQEHPGLQRTFVTIIVAGIIVLALGLLAAFMGWGGHHEAAGHAATAAGHARLQKGFARQASAGLHLGCHVLENGQ